MGKLSVNPYLPEGEYFPDGEPHVFNHRLYVYPSHDRYGGKAYCEGDYIVWSADIDDLGVWTKRGVAFPRKSPNNPSGRQFMWAPDCVKADDGKFYLYYCYAFDNHVYVLVSDYPDGPFTPYGTVHYEDGTDYGHKEKDIACFDPGVFKDDDGQVYLYSGFSPKEQMIKMLKLRCHINNMRNDGGQVIKLASDMLTVKGEPKMLIPGINNSRGTAFKGHEMYEASSMRKINGKYYFIYSTILSHELAYAISDRPDEGFKFGGVLISNGDIGYRGLEEKDAHAYWGNNHGSIASVNGKYYIFYHRQTNRNEQTRQGCAEPLTIKKDGSIPMVEMTSSGMNGPFEPTGVFPSYIACNLKAKEGACKCVSYGPIHTKGYRHFPYIGEYENGKQCVLNLRDGSKVGFKYFKMNGKKTVKVTIRGQKGKLLISDTIDGQVKGEINLIKSRRWSSFSTVIDFGKGKEGIYFTYEGKGKIDFKEFELI